MLGQDRCRMHGGSAPQAREAARRRLALAAARAKLDDLEVQPVGDPFEALEQLAAEALALRRLLADRVAAIEAEPAAKPADVRAEWRAYSEALDRAERFVRDLAGLGLDERRVALSERQGEAIARVLVAVTGAVFRLLAERLGEEVAPVLEEVRGQAPALLRAELLRVEEAEDA